MITKEEFRDLILKHKEWDKRITEVSDTLNCNIWEADWVEYSALLFDKVLEFLFTEEGIDNIAWWIWEKPEHGGLWDKDGNDIPIDTIDDLWELIKDYRK